MKYRQSNIVFYSLVINQESTRGRVTSSHKVREQHPAVRASLSNFRVADLPRYHPAVKRAWLGAGSQTVSLSPGIKYSRWVGVARRFCGQRGRIVREERGYEAVRSSVAGRSMLGCAAGEGRKEANEKERSPCRWREEKEGWLFLTLSLTLAPLRPPLSSGLTLPSSSSENVLPSSDGSAPGAPARLGGVAFARGRRTWKSGMKGPLPGILTRPLYSAPHSAATRAASLHLPSLRLHSPGPPRSPHSVLGVIACSIKPDVRWRRARRRPPACVLASRSFSLLFSLSLCLSWVYVYPPHSYPSCDAITKRRI